MHLSEYLTRLIEDVCGVCTADSIQELQTFCIVSDHLTYKLNTDILKQGKTLGNIVLSQASLL